MTQSKNMPTKSAENIHERHDDAHAIRPAVDIYEDDKGISLYADMPGVSKNNLEIKVDGDSMTIEGRVEIKAPENSILHHTDITTTLYRRNFSLSSELDDEQADASFKDGVLSLHIPKRRQHQARKIEVRAS